MCVTRILGEVTNPFHGLAEIKREVAAIKRAVVPAPGPFMRSSGLFGLPSNAKSVDWMVLNDSAVPQTFTMTEYRAGGGPKTVVAPVEHMPCTGRLLLPNPKPSAAFYDFDEYERLVTAAKAADSRAHLIAMLGGEAGLRCGEMMALEWADVGRRAAACVQGLPPVLLGHALRTQNRERCGGGPLRRQRLNTRPRNRVPSESSQSLGPAPQKLIAWGRACSPYGFTSSLVTK